MHKTHLQDILKLRCHISIVHHVKGRIRLRISQSLIEQIPMDKMKIPDPQEAFSSLTGIKNVRINWLAALVVVKYDPGCIPPHHWEKLIHGNDLEAEKILMAFNVNMFQK